MSKITAEKLRNKIFQEKNYTERGWREILKTCQFVIELRETIGAERLEKLNDSLDNRLFFTLDAIRYLVNMEEE